MAIIRVIDKKKKKGGVEISFNEDRTLLHDLLLFSFFFFYMLKLS